MCEANIFRWIISRNEPFNNSFKFCARQCLFCLFSVLFRSPCACVCVLPCKCSHSLNATINTQPIRWMNFSTTEWSRSALRVILTVFYGVADACIQIVHTLMFILVHRLPQQPIIVSSITFWIVKDRRYLQPVIIFCFHPYFCVFFSSRQQLNCKFASFYSVHCLKLNIFLIDSIFSVFFLGRVFTGVHSIKTNILLQELFNMGNSSIRLRLDKLALPKKISFEITLQHGKRVQVQMLYPPSWREELRDAAFPVLVEV